MYALIQHDDIKSKELAKKINNIEMFKMGGSVNKIPIHIVYQFLKRRKKPEAIILRYLNDSTTLTKSLIRVFTIMLTILLVKIMKIKLIWLCHNVDKESKEYYPLFVKLKRSMVIKASSKILVTDKLLVKHAVRLLNVRQSKIDYITFGEPKINTLNTDKKIEKRIIKFIQNNENDNTLIGLSIGNPNVKVLHPFYTENLITNAKKYGYNLKIILGGPLGNFIKTRDIQTYEKLTTNPNILFLDGKININEKYIAKYVDFYWRVYDDYSVPYTIYNAVHFNKPILTMEKGLLGELVREYDIGTVIKNDMANLEEALIDLNRDRKSSFKKFIDTHNWSIGAQKIYQNII